MALNPALRALIAAAAAKYPADSAATDGVELPVPHLVACLAELGLHKATKKELICVVQTALAREAAELRAA